MSTAFCECVAVHGRVDREGAVIHGVKIVGTESRNGRTYTAAALRGAASLYENVPVYADHAVGAPGAPRSVRDKIGVLRSVRFASNALYGDLHFIATHPLAESLLWCALHDPSLLGLSHNVLGRVVRKGDRDVVEAITKVVSVDLVAEPAATSGLFESLASIPAALAERIRAAFYRLPRDAKELARRLKEGVDPFSPSVTAGETDEEQPWLDALVRIFQGGEPVEQRVRKIEALLTAYDEARNEATDVATTIRNIMGDSMPGSASESYILPRDAKSFADRLMGRSTGDGRLLAEALRG